MEYAREFIDSTQKSDKEINNRYFIFTSQNLPNLTAKPFKCHYSGSLKNFMYYLKSIEIIRHIGLFLVQGEYKTIKILWLTHFYILILY